MRRAVRSDDREAGFGTVLSLGLVAVILAAGGVAASVAVVTASRHRATAAADLAALAAAGRVLEGEGVACDAARHVTRAQRVTLISCRLDGLDAVVEVGVRPPGRLASLGQVRGKARAGRR